MFSFKNYQHHFWNWVFATLLSLSWPVFSAESEIQQLAEEAKQRFSKVMHPPIFENPLDTHAIYLAKSNPHRAYVVKSFEEAIDAIVAEAERPKQMSIVTSALRDLIKRGETVAIDQVFASMLERELASHKSPNPQAAAILRHSVAIVELPIALQPTTFPTVHPVMLSPFVRLTLNGAISTTSGLKPMPGPKTLPAYLKAAELDPGHLWTWIIIANLSEHPQDFVNALAKAEEIAQANEDKHALVFVKLESGHLAKKFEQREKATQAYAEAVNMTSTGLIENPMDDTWKQDLASALTSLGNRQSLDLKQSVSNHEKAVNLRNQLVNSHPENVQFKLDLAVAHYWLGNARWYLSGKKEVPEDRKYFDEAYRIYDDLTASDRWKFTLRLNTGVVFSILMYAGGLTLTIGLALIFLYKKRITRWMHAAASTKTALVTEPDQTTGQKANQSRVIEFNWLTAKSKTPENSFVSVQMTTSLQHDRHATWYYVLGGVVFALIAAILGLTLGKIEITTIRLLSFCLNYAWPVVLTLWLLWGPDRKRLAITLLAYFGILLAVCVRVGLSDTPELKVFGFIIPAVYQPIILWFFTVDSSLFLLLFLNRHLRTVGPVLLVFMMTLVIGSTVIWFIGSSAAGMYAWVNFTLWLEQTPGISLNTAYAMWWLAILGALLITPVGIWFVRGLCRNYAEKRYSEMTLIVDSIWLFETGILCINLSNEEGKGYWFGLTAFIAYKAITYFGLRSISREAQKIAPAKLLLLRVFGFKRRTERLFKLLEARWRYAGPIQLIAAPDLASSTADPGDFLSFISGNLRKQFIIEPSDIEQRLSTMDYAPDPDGRYRVNEIFCGNDAWRPVVQKLMMGSDLVVMDLRGFSDKNQGCLFELQALVDYVPFERMVLLVDDKTDTDLLSQTLTSRWQQANISSPNIKGSGLIHILKVGKWDEEAIVTLLKVADERLHQAA